MTSAPSLVIISVLSTWCLGAAVAVITRDKRTTRQSEAASLWNAHSLRNGVTAVSPFHGADTHMNAPGLVRVYPRTQQPDRESNAPVQPASPLETIVDSSFPPLESEKRETEKFSEETRYGYVKGGYDPYEICDAARVKLQSLVDAGETRKTALCWAVFGHQGGNGYKAAKPFILEILDNA